MSRIRSCLVTAVVALSLLPACAPATEDVKAERPAAEMRSQVAPDSDPRAVEIARAVMVQMGGQESWDRTRYLSWKFFGRRDHHWDRWTGNVRIEGPTGEDTMLWIMNVDSREGRVWKNGEEIADPDELAEALDLGRQVWVNDSYWLVMPYKLLDPGVTLKDAGEREMEDGRVADVLELTFDEGVGYTPENRYEVFVAKDTGLVEQWSFYGDAGDDEPGFTGPWSGWRQFGDIMLATGRGRDFDWEIAVHEDLPASIFEIPGLDGE